jgi:hypothetical protein
MKRLERRSDEEKKTSPYQDLRNERIPKPTHLSRMKLFRPKLKTIVEAPDSIKTPQDAQQAIAALADKQNHQDNYLPWLKF